MHIGDTLRHLTYGTHGTIVDMSDTHLTAEFPTENGPERISYLHGSVTGKSGYVQHAEIVECPHVPTRITAVEPENNREVMAYNLGVLENVLREVRLMARAHRYPAVPQTAAVLLEGYAKIESLITVGVGTMKCRENESVPNGAVYIMHNPSSNPFDFAPKH